MLLRRRLDLLLARYYSSHRRSRRLSPCGSVAALDSCAILVIHAVLIVLDPARILCCVSRGSQRHLSTDASLIDNDIVLRIFTARF